MDKIVQHLLKRSIQDVKLIRITNATDESLNVTLESHVMGTGPIATTISAMNVDLFYDGVCWGRMQLDETRTNPAGTDVNVYEKPVTLANLDAFRSFVKALMSSDNAILRLDNGHCLLSSRILGMPLSLDCVYQKDIPIRGMGGPQISVKQCTSSTMTFRVVNQGPMELDRGHCEFELVDIDGDPLARLNGPLNIVRGEFDVKLNVEYLKTTNKVVFAEDKAHLRGISSQVKGCTGETIQSVDCEVEITAHFARFMAA